MIDHHASLSYVCAVLPETIAELASLQALDVSSNALGVSSNAFGVKGAKSVAKVLTRYVGHSVCQLSAYYDALCIG